MKKNETKDTCSGQKYTKAIYAFYQFPRNTFQMHIYHWWNKLCVLVHACRHCVWLCTYLFCRDLRRVWLMPAQQQVSRQASILADSRRPKSMA